MQTHKNFDQVMKGDRRRGAIAVPNKQPLRGRKIRVTKIDEENSSQWI